MSAKGGMVQERDSHFNDLKHMVNKLLRKARKTAPWISDATWRLVGQRTALGRKFTANQQERRMAT